MNSYVCKGYESDEEKPLPEHTSKRQGSAGEDGSCADNKAAPMLVPDDVWSTGIFPYLDYQSILRCSEVSRHFLRGIIPKVKRVVIERSGDMHIIPARKFEGVERIDVRGFVTYDPNLILCEETSERFVPFIGCFPKARLVRFCAEGICLNLQGSNTREYEIVHRLVLSLCAAYRTGSISPNLTIDSIFEEMGSLQRYLHGNEYTNGTILDTIFTQYNSNLPGCRFCSTICSSIPLKEACRLRCASYRGEFFDRGEFFVDPEYQREAHDICLLSEEKVDIITSRNGGKEAYFDRFKDFYSNEKMSIMSIWGTKSFTCAADGTPNPHGDHHANVFAGELDTIKDLQVLINKYGFPPLSHSEQYVIERLFNDVCFEEQLTKNKDKCFMARLTFEALRKLGLPLSQRFFILVDDKYLHESDDESLRLKYYYDDYDGAFEFEEKDCKRLRKAFQS